MIISVKEGTKLAEDLVSSLCASAHKSNYVELMSHFFADNVEWKSPDGAEGTGSPEALLELIKNTWGAVCSYATHTKPFVCVDTENGRVVVTFTMIANVNARREGVTNIVQNTVTYILVVNKDKKINRWSSVWDNRNKATAIAFAKLGIELPKPENEQVLITQAEGEAFVAKYLKAFSDGFLDNSHAEKCRDLIADNVCWDWSDGTKGSGTRDEMLGILAKNWCPLISSWTPVDPIVVVDTTHRVVAISFHVVSNAPVGLTGEIGPLMLPHVFVVHLDENHRVIKANACWDNNDADLQANIKKIKAKLEMAQTAPGKVLNVGSPMEGIMSGQ